MIPDQVISVTLAQKALFAGLAIALLTFVARLVQKRHIELRHALSWLVVGVGLLICSIFPELLLGVSRLIGFKLVSNAVMSLSLVGLVFLVLAQSVSLSRTKRDLRQLAQRMALLEADRSSKRVSHSVQHGI